MNPNSTKYEINHPPKNTRIQMTAGFPGGSDGKEYTCDAGDVGSIPGSGRSPGEGNGNPLQFLPGESHGQSLAGSYGHN